MPEGTESGLKWWVRYFIVPLIGGGGLIAIMLTLLTRPPGHDANIRSTPTPIVSPTLPVDPRSTQGASPSASPNNSRLVNARIADSARIPEAGPPSGSNSRGEDSFRQLLRDAGQLLRVGQYGPACKNYLRAANSIPDKFKGTVKRDLIERAKSHFRDKDFAPCAKQFQDAFESIALD